MKTLSDYMNDSSVAHLQMPLREVKAIRLMIHDEIKNMTPAERTAYFNNSARKAREEYGFKFKIVSSAKEITAPTV